jgi:hypothetical protein
MQKKLCAVSGLAALLFAVAATLMLDSTAAAQASRVASAQVKKDILKNARPLHNDKVSAAGIKGRAASGLRTAIQAASVPGIDSLANWTDTFTADGFDGAGNPQSEWPFEMVGGPPEDGRTTVINMPVIPVTLELLDASNVVVLSQTVPNSMVNDVLRSPMFQPFIYTSGVGQFNDQMMRAQFADRMRSGYHVLLSPTVKTRRRLQVPFGSYHFALNDDGSCCLFVLVDANAFVTDLFPAGFPFDNSTVIGAAENAGDMRTRDMTTLLFNNVFLYQGNPNNCCIVGFHSYDLEPGIPANGNRERRYVMNYSSWVTSGLFLFGFEDITALGHEIAETFNDPFVDNATPWWLSIDGFFGPSLCQNNLESGDVVEVLTSNPTYPIAMNNRTYHPSNEALFSWFAFQSPSHARLGAYSFPDETTVPALSPGPLLPGCVTP